MALNRQENWTFFLLDEIFAFVLLNDYFYVKNFCFLYLKKKNESFHGPVHQPVWILNLLSSNELNI